MSVLSKILNAIVPVVRKAARDVAIDTATKIVGDNLDCLLRGGDLDAAIRQVAYELTTIRHMLDAGNSTGAVARLNDIEAAMREYLVGGEI